MKLFRRLLFIAVAVFFSASLSGQKLGFVGGQSLNHGTIVSTDKNASFTAIPGAGFHAGLLFEMDVTNRWGFDVSLMYELRTMRWNMNYAGVDTTNRFKREIGYLNLPAHLYVNFPVNDRFRVSLFLGPVFTCGLHATDWAWMMTETKRPVTYAKDKIFDKKSGGRIVRCEFAAELGMAFKWNNWQGRVSYQYGINNSTLNNYRYTLPVEQKTVNYLTQGTLKLSVAYLFDLRK